MGFLEEVRLNGEEGEKCYFKCLKLRGKQDILNPVDIRFFLKKQICHRLNKSHLKKHYVLDIMAWSDLFTGNL